FLAGHTDIRRDIHRQDQFCLLLPSFPFAEDEPVVVAMRGPGRKDPAAPPDDPRTVLPYVALYRMIARMSALNRLVIIDACQAEAIFTDPRVQRIQEKIDDGAHRARTSYILAARLGEPANEVQALEHGLLTYLLLRGM